MTKTLLALAALSMLAACATGPETSTSATSQRARPDDSEFTTGSNIPRRNRLGGDGVSVMTKEEFERARTAGGQGGQGVMPGSTQ
ncbi:MAG TPA: hypothetical protein VEC19_04345 [Usitatibacter sp.]|nr:hypothetical protein [Usitatibacter sp.]